MPPLWPRPHYPGLVRRRLLFVFIALLLILLGFEGLFRVLETHVRGLLGPFEIEEVPEPLGFDPFHEVGHLDRNDVMNAAGYRGPLHGTEREPNTFRVAVLGDSFTFGWGVAEQEAWPALLQARLAAELPGLSVEVLNFGVPGYNTWLQLLHWQRVVSRYRPDAVLLGYYSNDAAIDRRVPDVYRLCPLPGPTAPRLFAAAQGRSALVRGVHDLVWFVRVGSPVPPWDSDVVLREEHYGFACSMAWLVELSEDVHASGARFAVVQLPHMDGLDDPFDPEAAAQERLKAALDARGIATINLYPRLAGTDPDLVNNADDHPDAAGNQALLHALWPVTGQWLLARGLVLRSESKQDGPPPSPEAGRP